MIGVIVVTYGSSDVIEACLESLRVSEGPELRVMICDNASLDNTCDVVRDWAARAGVSFAEHPAEGAEDLPFDALAPFTLLTSAANTGFAGGVNIGLRALRPHDAIDLFWVLNPDSEAMPDTAAAYAARAADVGRFGLMGGRVTYHETPDMLQSDGGRVNWRTGVCTNINIGQNPDHVTMPDPDTLDFISGANVVASRAFIDAVGLMEEDYFLYYEEVDWAARRGDLPFALASEARVRHHAGTAIGSGTVSRRPSAFSNYFNYRNRIWFLRRFKRRALPGAYAFGLAKTIQLVLLGGFDEAIGAVRGLLNMGPPAAVRARVSDNAREMAFGRR